MIPDPAGKTPDGPPETESPVMSCHQARDGTNGTVRGSHPEDECRRRPLAVEVDVLQRPMYFKPREHRRTVHLPEVGAVPLSGLLGYCIPVLGGVGIDIEQANVRPEQSRKCLHITFPPLPVSARRSPCMRWRVGR